MRFMFACQRFCARSLSASTPAARFKHDLVWTLQEARANGGKGNLAPRKCRVGSTWGRGGGAMGLSVMNDLTNHANKGRDRNDASRGCESS